MKFALQLSYFKMSSKMHSLKKKILILLNHTAIAEITSETGLSQAKALDRLLKDTTVYNISKEEYLKQKYYVLDEEILDAFFKDDTSKLYVEIIGEHYSIPFATLYSQILRAKNDYKIPITHFAKKRLYLSFDDDTLSIVRQQRRESLIQVRTRLMDITGWDEETAKNYISSIKKQYNVTSLGIMNFELYNKTDAEIKQLFNDRKKAVIERNNRIIEKTGWNESELEKHMLKCRILYGIVQDEYENIRCYELDDAELNKLANFDDGNLLSNTYNTDSVEILRNKFDFYNCYKPFIGRKYWTNKDTNFEEFEQFVGNNTSLFLKPLDLRAGIGTKVIDVPEDHNLFYNDMLKQPKVLLEEIVLQHHEMSEFYDKSVNTVRLFTISKDGNFDAFAAFIRFGAGGVADNLTAGGIGCGVDEKTGIITTSAMDKYGHFYDKHPITGKSFQGFQIPHWDKVLKIAEDALNHLEGINYVGWDIAIREDDVVIIEGNSAPSLCVYQAFYSNNYEGKKYKYSKYLPEDIYTNIQLLSK